MWEREILKSRGKKVLKANYKMCVIVCIIVYTLMSIFDGGSESSSNSSDDIYYDNSGMEYYIDENSGELVYITPTDNMLDFQLDVSPGDMIVDGSNLLAFNIFNSITAGTLFITGIVIFILNTILRSFVYNPIVIGKNNFFMGIREDNRKISDIFFLFKKEGYLKSVITMFIMDLYLILWTLLLVIPGIIKGYEYSMIPYILSENPDIERQRAFEISKHMTEGQKWNIFVLDISFMGWHLLSIFTLGLLNVFYVNPYYETTRAELYDVLRENSLRDGFASYDELIGFNKN